MNLEDHVGDIIRKSRQMTGVSEETVAKAAGLTLEELLGWEDSGQISKRPDFRRFAPLIDLHPDKLERIANGWLPERPDLSVWRELRQITTESNAMAVHCYLLWDEVTREAALFDTGFDPAPVFKLIEQNQLQLKYLFVTHTHADHIAGMEAVQNRFAKVRLHTNAKSAPPQHRNRPNDCLQLGSLRITNRDTPGHAEDGVTYVIGTWPEDAPHVVIVGDAIFAGSMGGAKQCGALAKQKVREQILSLPPQTLICPGHGPLTTVGQEKENNPFFV